MKKKEIADSLLELFGHITESLGKAYNCFIDVQLDIKIKPMPKRKIGFKKRVNNV